MKGQRKIGRKTRIKEVEKRKVRKRERFWAPSKREQTKGSRRTWNGTTGANALAEDTENSRLVSRAYFLVVVVGWG